MEILAAIELYVVSEGFFFLQYFSTILLQLGNRNENTVIRFIVQEELQILGLKFLVEQDKEKDNWLDSSFREKYLVLQRISI